MVDLQDGDQLVTSFLRALSLRNLDECERLWREAQHQAPSQARYAAIALYFESILANERQRDPGRAVDLLSRLLTEALDPGLRSRTLIALGRTLDYLGRWDEAIRAYEQTLSIYQDRGQPTEQAKVWKNIASVCVKAYAQGDYGPDALERAVQYCELALQALPPLAEAQPDDVWLIGSVWNQLGILHARQRQWDQALHCYHQDLAICCQLGDTYGQAQSYVNIGEVHHKSGSSNWPQAQIAYRQALAMERLEGDSYVEIDILTNLALLAQDMGDLDTALACFAQAIALIERLRSGISTVQARADVFATIVDTYAHAILLCVAAGHLDIAFNYVEQARARAFLDSLAARSYDLAHSVDATPATLAQVQAALSEDAILLAYFTTGLLEAEAMSASQASTTVERHRFPPSRTLLWVVTKTTVQVTDLGLSPNDLRPQRLDRVVERHFLEPSTRRTLYNHLIAPVTTDLVGKQRVYLVPHGPLHYIPFQALLAPDGAPLLRAEGAEWVYVPSASYLLRQRRPRSQAPRACLALGYNGSGDSRLRLTEEEAQRVAEMYDGDYLVGPTPKRQTLRESGHLYRLLHLSCHGDFDPLAPLASALYLAPDERLTALDVLNEMRFTCDLVTLSACETGLSRVRRGDDLLGMVRAFATAGAPAQIVTLWRVDERATLLLMNRFYQAVQAGVGFAEALKQAQLYLKGLTYEAALVAVADASQARSGAAVSDSLWQAQVSLKGHAALDVRSEPGDGQRHIFEEPFYWAAFILVGDHGSDPDPTGLGATLG